MTEWNAYPHPTAFDAWLVVEEGKNPEFYREASDDEYLAALDREFLAFAREAYPDLDDGEAAARLFELMVNLPIELEGAG